MRDRAAPETQGPRRRRWQVFVLAGILLVLAIYVGFDAWTASRLRRVTADLEQRHGTLAHDSLRTEPVPPAENRARLVRAAAALSVPPTKSVQAFISEAGRSQTIPPITAELRAFVEANREALGTAQRFTSRQRSSWEIEPDGSNMPDLLEIRQLSNVLFLSAMIEIEAGRPDEAAKAIVSGLALSASMREENQLIVQLIRIGVSLHQADAIRRLLATADPSAQSLTELATRLAENRTPDPLRLALAGELKRGQYLFSQLERGRVDGAVRTSDHLLAVLGRLGKPFVKLAQVAYLERMRALIDVQSGRRPKGPFPDLEGSVLSRWALGGLTGLARAVETGDEFMSIQAAAEIAVALRRHRLDHGKYPDDLGPLVPAYLPALPIDPFTGKPPVYERTAAGYTLLAQRYTSQPPNSQPAITWVINR